MKKNLIAKLEQIAKDLPEVFEKKPMVVPHEMAKQHYKRANPNRLYTTNTLQPVNHLTKLKAAYKFGGDAAVTKYASEQHIIAGRQREQQRQAVAKMRSVQTI